MSAMKSIVFLNLHYRTTREMNYIFGESIFSMTDTVKFHIINLFFFQEKLVTSMSREDIDLVANSEDAVSIEDCKFATVI